MLKLDREPAVWFNLDPDAGSRERGIDSLADRTRVTNLENCLDCRRQVPAIMTEDRRASSKPWDSSRRIDIRAELILTIPPAAVSANSRKAL